MLDRVIKIVGTPKVIPWHYVGIGARFDVPDSVLQLMSDVACSLAVKGLLLRSGGAEGSDSAFEMGVLRANEQYQMGAMEIYLPWNGFNGKSASVVSSLGYYVGSEPNAEAIAKIFHPAYGRLKPPVKALMRRNTYQALGFDLSSLPRFCVCYTRNGSLTGFESGSGGTGQALRLLSTLGVPIYNFGLCSHREKFQDWLGA
ncbi:hypothetical protein AB4254_08985 [Vibrio breoganii]